MNPSLKFILAFIVSLEISLKASLTTNILVIAFALVYLLVTKTKLKELLLLIILPFIAAFTIFATLYWFSPTPDPYYAWNLSTRVYVYTLTIACVTRKVTATDLLVRWNEICTCRASLRTAFWQRSISFRRCVWRSIKSAPRR